VEVTSLDVRDAFRIAEGEGNDATERRLTSVKRAKRAFDRHAGHLGIDEVVDGDDLDVGGPLDEGL